MDIELNSSQHRNHLLVPDDAVAFRQRMTTLDISQWELANALGVSQGSLSQWLRRVTPMPEGMEARIHGALDRLERVKLAGQAAEERAMTHELTHSPEAPVPGCEWCQETLDKLERVLREDTEPCG